MIKERSTSNTWNLPQHQHQPMKTGHPNPALWLWGQCTTECFGSNLDCVDSASDPSHRQQSCALYGGKLSWCLSFGSSDEGNPGFFGPFPSPQRKWPVSSEPRIYQLMVMTKIDVQSKQTGYKNLNKINKQNTQWYNQINKYPSATQQTPGVRKAQRQLEVCPLPPVSKARNAAVAEPWVLHGHIAVHRQIMKEIGLNSAIKKILFRLYQPFIYT